MLPDAAVRARMVVVPEWLQEQGCCGARCGCKSKDGCGA